MADAKYLNPIYNNGNLLREIGTLAQAIEDQTGIAVVRCNVGDPTGPTFPLANKAMGKFYDERPGSTASLMCPQGLSPETFLDPRTAGERTRGEAGHSGG